MYCSPYLLALLTEMDVHFFLPVFAELRINCISFYVEILKAREFLDDKYTDITRSVLTCVRKCLLWVSKNTRKEKKKSVCFSPALKTRERKTKMWELNVSMNT